MTNIYKKQVFLLLSVLPEVAKEDCFALHGGTAINLFVRDLPRLSVDIDLTYIPNEERKEALAGISIGLIRIQDRIKSLIPNAKIIFKREISKLLVTHNGASIKIEVNQTNRGIFQPTVTRLLTIKAQEEFDAFCSIKTVSDGQLYGGKICAALDRQHPRDLFDVNHLLKNEGITDDIKQGLILSLLSSKRPLNELLNPNLLDQRSSFRNQFQGMSLEAFSYDEFEATRSELITTVLNSFSEIDKEFFIRFHELNPNWEIHDLQNFPSIKWKTQNLERLKQENPEKHEESISLIKRAMRYQDLESET